MITIGLSRSFAQNVNVNPTLLHHEWSAWWITCPDVPLHDYGVYHFRKVITLALKPQRFIIHISADNRYRLFINGKSVCSGPARGDLYSWYFESIDISKYLTQGKNIIAAMVWNMGSYAAVFQVSNQTAFTLQGDGLNEQIINTDSTWKVKVNKAYTPCSTDNSHRMNTYMVVGPGDEVNASLYPWGWERADYNDIDWQNASTVSHPVTAGNGTDNMWTLRPRNIPLMEESLQRISTVRRVKGIEVSDKFLKGEGKLVIPAHQTVTILLDQSYNMVAYPELLVSGGKDAVIKVTYAEALFKNGVKGNRDSIAGKKIIGNYDIFKPDGGDNRLFRPLWLRTYRYIQLNITTQNMPLTINDYYGMATGYPFTARARFESNDPSMQDIWNVGWRTAKLCAGETYYDCPYYEQLQYIGDTRIQALISLYVTGDDRLMRKAMLDFYYSRVPEGLTQSRYPSNRLQVIPPFSLYWVSMIHDYLMLRQDDTFLKQFLLPVEGVLKWYEDHIDPNKKMLGAMPWWNFTDWSAPFDFGVPPGAKDGNSAIITLQYVYSLDQAVDIFEYFGKRSLADHYRKLAIALKTATYRNCFDLERAEMADTPEKVIYSQHASIMAVLTGTIPVTQMQQVMENVLKDTSLSQATFYYRFYLTKALKKANMGNLYYAQLKPWREMLKQGLTTFAENPDPARSDCHAWSASPNYDFLATICGINAAAPGFKKVQIKPQLGELKRVYGIMPHPAGNLSVSVSKNGTQGCNAEIMLPPGITGEFIWNDKGIPLVSGINKIKR